MAHIELETTINAPIGAVFDLLQATERGPEWMADLQEVHNVTGHQVGDSSEWTFKMLGRPFTGKTYIRDLDSPHTMKLETVGGIPSTWEWRFTAAPDESTLLRVTIDYTVPIVLLGKLIDKLFIERQNERQMRTSLANLKALAEQEHGGTQTRETQV